MLVGCPRSGTSWLQLLLAQHPNVATTQETHLFSGYLRHVKREWEGRKSRQEEIGMTQLLAEADFNVLCADFARKVFQKIADTNPVATVVLEKTPAHIREAPFILELLPEVAFIHIIRDPRSVVASLGAAARSWGSRWASRSVVSNAKLWRSDVTLGRRIADLTTRYREIRYEDLLGAAGPAVLESLFAWLHLPVDRGFCTAAFTACQIERLRQGGDGVRSYEPLKRPQAQFFRKGQADGWKEDLSPAAVRIVEYVNRDLMEQCGYTCRYAPPRGFRRPSRLAVHDALDHVERWVRSRAKGAFRRARAPL